MDAPTALSVRLKPIKYITPEDYLKMIGWIENNQKSKSERNLLLFKLMWNLGARISEVLAIKVSDVNFNERWIRNTVLKKNPIRKDDFVGLTMKKAEKLKLLKYNVLTAEQLESLRAGNRIQVSDEQILLLKSRLPAVINQIPVKPELIRDIELYVLKNKLEKSDQLFKLERIQAWRIVSSISEKALGCRFGPHAFRHGLAMNLLSQNVHPAVLQSILAHSSLSTTFNVYAVVTDEMKRKALESRV